MTNLQPTTAIWVRLIKHQRIDRSVTVHCAYDDWQEALIEACRELDMPRPMILPRHTRDWDSFRQTRFLPEHFMEDFPFQRMEVEFIDPDKKKKRATLFEE